MVQVLGAKLAKFDVEKEEPARDPKTGFLVECSDGEVGELLGLISRDKPFKGYTDASASATKVTQTMPEHVDV